MYCLHEGGVNMAKCSICGKSAHFGHNVSHSNRKTNAVWKANVNLFVLRLTAATRE